MSTNQYIRSVTEMVPDEFPKLDPLPPPPSGSFFDFSWKTWIIIILLLALLGINVFAFLAKGTQDIATIFRNIFGPLLGYFGYQTLEVAKETVETSAEGTKAGVDVVSDTVVGTIDTIQDAHMPDDERWQKDTLAKALDTQQRQSQQHEVLPDDSRSSVQTTGKQGWCYIGEDDGVRTCSQIGVNDTCMSGDVFPTQSVCVNPKLRV